MACQPTYLAQGATVLLPFLRHSSEQQCAKEGSVVSSKLFFCVSYKEMEYTVLYKLTTSSKLTRFYLLIVMLSIRTHAQNSFIIIFLGDTSYN